MFAASAQFAIKFLGVVMRPQIVNQRIAVGEVGN